MHHSISTGSIELQKESVGIKLFTEQIAAKHRVLKENKNRANPLLLPMGPRIMYNPTTV